jgi:DNA-binding NarL/FixJ family response regulator
VTDHAPERTITVLVCDDHAVFRRGLAIVLGDEPDLVLVGEAEDTDGAVAQTEALRPEVVLLDLRMPGGGGVEALRRIREQAPATRVVILTVSDDDADLFEAVAAGAAGYLLKEVSIEDVGAAVRTVAAGGSLLSPAMTAKLLGGFSDLAGGRTPTSSSSSASPSSSSAPATPTGTTPSTRAIELTKRERETLAGLAHGRSNRAIAEDLGIAENTVKNHVRAVLEKLGVATRTEAATLALREGLLTDD